jgi:mannose-6-phosphate isomerase
MIEHAVVRTKPKPWGRTDLRPWSLLGTTDGPIGELWFERRGFAAPETKLLLKLLFTSEPLSIQVHPDDVFARSIGLPRGKTEAWYILSAIPGAQVAVGLNYPRSSAELRTAIANGSIANIVHWHPVGRGDAVFIPAGTVHAIGAGIVLAEIQQNSDATFRMFDYGRRRELQIDHAVAVATPGPREPQSLPERLSSTRIVLSLNPHFVLEQIKLDPGSVWMLDAPHETWFLSIEGHALVGPTALSLGNAMFLEADKAEIVVGPAGLTALLAYPGPRVNFDALRANGSVGLNSPPSAPVAPAYLALQPSEIASWLL